MITKCFAFFFYITAGILFGLVIHFLLGNFELFSDSMILGMPLRTLIAILVAVPVANWLGSKVFGARSFGEPL